MPSRRKFVIDERNRDRAANGGEDPAQFSWLGCLTCGDFTVPSTEMERKSALRIENREEWPDGPVGGTPVSQLPCETCLRQSFTPALPYTEDGEAAIDFVYLHGQAQMPDELQHFNFYTEVLYQQKTEKEEGRGKILSTSFHLNPPAVIRATVARWNAPNGVLAVGTDAGGAHSRQWTDQSCDVCYKYSADETFKSCGRCKTWLATRYCSTECQKIDWKRGHKRRCTAALPLTYDGAPPEEGAAEAEDGCAEATLPDELLEKIFARIVDDGTVTELPRLMLVCKRWRVVASKPTLWRFVRFAGGCKIQASGGVDARKEPPMQSVFRMLARNGRSVYLRKIELAFMHGVDGDSRLFFGSAPKSRFRHIDETCLMLMLGTLDLPGLTSITFRGWAAEPNAQRRSGEHRSVDDVGFYPFRRFLVQPGRAFTELTFIDCGIGSQPLLSVVSRCVRPLPCQHVPGFESSPCSWYPLASDTS